ncbi:glycoside hydrolase family 92 protein [Caballeronia sp. LZ043]|nr:glycoside hydrolase domain-containing protein [Caballeronia sp. LZ043]MDR5824426.1 glycoside hydrolase family 92 protein [Caballeronia sp. LZ043]
MDVRVPDFRTNAHRARWRQGQTVLPGLSKYIALGYLPDDAGIVIDSSHSNGTSSTTLEYASNDFAVSQFAQAMGDSTNATKLLARSHNWANVMKSNATELNGVSVTQPRNQKGTWPAYTTTDPVEGTAEEYMTWQPLAMLKTERAVAGLGRVFVRDAAAAFTGGKRVLRFAVRG